MTDIIRSTLRGKAKYAVVHEPKATYRSKSDSTYKGETEYRLTVQVEDQQEVKRFSTLLRELGVKSALKTIDRDGNAMSPEFTFKKLSKTADGRTFGTVTVVDKHLQKTEDLIGNGSEVIVQFKARKYTDPGTKRIRHSLDLEAVQVVDLVPYQADIPLLFEGSPIENLEEESGMLLKPVGDVKDIF